MNSIVHRLEQLKLELNNAISARGADGEPAYTAGIAAIIDAQQALEREIEIKLTYFKPSGKYYTDGSFMVPIHKTMYEVFEDVKALKATGLLPGLATGASGYIVYI